MSINLFSPPKEVQDELEAFKSFLDTTVPAKKLDKNVDIAAEKFAPGDLYNFLPEYHNIHHSLDNLRKFII